MNNRRLRPINFQQLRDLIRPEQVLRHWGWEPRSAPGMPLRGGCPMHGSKSPSSRTLSVADTVVYCHKCHWTGDAVALWAWHQQLPTLEAAYDLCALFGITPPVL